MRYYFFDDEWKPERRKWLWAKSEMMDVKEKIDYSTKRRYDVRKRYYARGFTIGSGFASLGIFFNIENMGESTIMNNYDIRKNLSEVQKYVNEIMSDVYALVFEDESFVSFKGDLIRLYHSEDSVDKAMRLLISELDAVGSDVKLKKIKIVVD